MEDSQATPPEQKNPKVVSILDSRQSKSGMKEYLVSWQKGSLKEDSWEPISNLLGAINLLILYQGERKLIKEKLPQFNIPSTEIIRRKVRVDPLTTPTQKQFQQKKLYQFDPSVGENRVEKQPEVKPAIRPILKNHSQITDKPVANDFQVSSRDTPHEQQKVKKKVIIDYLCFKDGKHLYSLQTSPQRTYVFTAERIKKQYPNQMIKFYQEKIRQHYINKR